MEGEEGRAEPKVSARRASSLQADTRGGGTFLTQTQGGVEQGRENVEGGRGEKGEGGLRQLLKGCAITALCFSSDRCTLTWGDDFGRVAIWDLSPLLRVLPTSGPSVEGVGGAGVGGEAGAGATRRASLSRARTGLVHATVPAPLERAATQTGEGDVGGGAGRPTPPLPLCGPSSGLSGVEVRMVHVWQAHQSAIASLQPILEPPSLFSTSTDQLASVWTADGNECYGSLLQGETLPSSVLLNRRTPWRFPAHSQQYSDNLTSRAAGILEEASAGRTLAIPHPQLPPNLTLIRTRTLNLILILNPLTCHFTFMLTAGLPLLHESQP